ncbi:UNVERIFIED_CONTAM: hypothetical protein K2H54_044682 [Gekko kuhli]
MGVIDLLFQVVWEEKNQKELLSFSSDTCLGMVLGMDREISFHYTSSASVGTLLPKPKILACSFMQGSLQDVFRHTWLAVGWGGGAEKVEQILTGGPVSKNERDCTSSGLLTVTKKMV